VLGFVNVGVLDDFFELGGTSILAARIAFMIQEHSVKSCSGAFVLQHRSVRALCKAVESLPSSAPSQALSPLDYATAAVASPPTLSSGQEQMLMLHSRDPKSGFYNQPLILGLFGSVDIERLHECIEVSYFSWHVFSILGTSQLIFEYIIFLCYAVSGCTT
jgi:hypothetical protein